MGRRTVLLLVAAVIAAVGTALVFLYVRGVDARASQEFDAVEVLKAVEMIQPGESLEDAQAAGKVEMGAVGRAEVLDGATTTTTDMGDMVALTSVFPGEQIVAARFGDPGEQEVLTIPDKKMAISVNLTDPARVAGFVTPGAEVAIFVSATPEVVGDQTKVLPKFTRLLIDRVSVIGVGTTTVVPTTTTDEQTGASTTEELPRTLLTLALDQDQAEKVLYAAGNGEVAFALLTEKSSVKAGPGVTATDIFK